MTTILCGAAEPRTTERAVIQDESLWLPLDELTRMTGWELKPEGACRDGVCVPIPEDRSREFMRGAGASTLFNLAALASHIGAPLLHDAKNDVWSLGEDTTAGAARMLSLNAPDFALPDLDGRTHHLSDYRGKKIFLLAWASW